MAIEAGKAGKGGIVPPIEHRFKKGGVGNPMGRPSAGLSVKEWWNQLQNTPRSELAKIMEDDDAPPAKVAAARAWIDACSQERTATGQPIAGADLDRIIDNTHGKATQPIELSGPDKKPIETKRRVDYDAIEAEFASIGITVAGGTPKDDRAE